MRGWFRDQVPIVDEFGGVWMQRYGRNLSEEGVALDVAMGAKAGGDAVEIAVVIAGMAAELEGSLRGHGVQDVVEGFVVEVAGGGDSDGSIGGEDLLAADLGLLFEPGLKVAEEFDLKAASAVAVAQSEAPGLLEWMADGVDAVLLGEAQQRSKDSRKEVSVFVGVEMSDFDACEIEFPDLGCGLAFDIVFANLAAQEGLDEVDERRTKGFAVRTDERWDVFRRRGRDAVGEDDVTAYTKGGVGAGDGDRIVKGLAGSHEGCRGEGAGLMEFGDSAIDAGSEAEVVRVNDESGRHRWRGIGVRMLRSIIAGQRNSRRKRTTRTKCGNSSTTRLTVRP